MSDEIKKNVNNLILHRSLCIGIVKENDNKKYDLNMTLPEIGVDPILEIETNLQKILKNRYKEYYPKNTASLNKTIIENPVNITNYTPQNRHFRICHERILKKDETLDSPSLKKLKEIGKEGDAVELHNELFKSNLRLISIKRGTRIKEVINEKDCDFYLPSVKPNISLSDHQRSKSMLTGAKITSHLSYISNRPIKSYISLKSIEQLYENVLGKNTRDSPFSRLIKGGKNRFVEFMDFTTNQWIQEAIYGNEIKYPPQRSISLFKKIV